MEIEWHRWPNKLRNRPMTWLKAQWMTWKIVQWIKEDSPINYYPIAGIFDIIYISFQCSIKSIGRVNSQQVEQTGGCKTITKISDKWFHILERSRIKTLQLSCRVAYSGILLNLNHFYLDTVWVLCDQESLWFDLCGKGYGSILVLQIKIMEEYLKIRAFARSHQREVSIVLWSWN